MAYQTPKTDWNEAYTPSPSDMNRIEGNTKANRDDRIAGDNALDAKILLEESARIASDGVLNSAISAEESARIAGDNAIKSTELAGINLSTAQVTWFEWTTTSGIFTIPRGFFYVFGVTISFGSIVNQIVVQIDTPTGWTTVSSGFYYSTGSNVRLNNIRNDGGASITARYGRIQ